MNEIILCKLGEVVLKGLNRRSFEMKLMSNIRRRTARFGKFRIYSKQSTIYVEPAEETCDLSGAYAACKQVFGIIAIARAVPCPKEKEAILATAKTYLGAALTAARSFKVESKRADKSFPMSSIQLSQWVGGELHEAYPHLKVDVHHPELTVYVEVREDAAYVHAPAEPAAGGLPIGMGGRAVSLLSGGIDSPVASYMMAKRGVQLEMIHFASPPYTSEQAREKVLQLARELVPWCGRLTVHVVPFAEIQEEIRRSCPEDHFTLIWGRWPARPWRRWPSVRTPPRCRCCVPSSAWIRRRSSASPAISAPSIPPFCPMRTAARCSPPVTPRRSPMWRRSGRWSRRWTWRVWSSGPWRTGTS